MRWGYSNCFKGGWRHQTWDKVNTQMLERNWKASRFAVLKNSPWINFHCFFHKVHWTEKLFYLKFWTPHARCLLCSNLFVYWDNMCNSIVIICFTMLRGLETRTIRSPGSLVAVDICSFCGLQSKTCVLKCIFQCV